MIMRLCMINLVEQGHHSRGDLDVPIPVYANVCLVGIRFPSAEELNRSIAAAPEEHLGGSTASE